MENVPITKYEILVGPVELATNATLYFTAPQHRLITEIYLTQDADARTVDLWLVPPGEVMADEHKLLDAFATIANDMRPVLNLHYPLTPTWKIYAKSSGAGTKLVIVARVI